MRIQDGTTRDDRIHHSDDGRVLSGVCHDQVDGGKENASVARDVAAQLLNVVNELVTEILIETHFHPQPQAPRLLDTPYYPPIHQDSQGGVRLGVPGTYRPKT